MLDIKLIREDPDKVRKMLVDRASEADIDGLLQADQNFRDKTGEVNDLKRQRNELAKTISQEKDGQKKAEIIQQTKSIAESIKTLDEDIRLAAEKRETILLTMPNFPHESVPVGQDEADNKVVRTQGEEVQLSFDGKQHGQIGLDLGIFDFTQGIKVAGAGFYLIRGNGARLEHALINYMLDVHREQGYLQVVPPYLVNRKAMTGTGQLPKFEDDMYHTPEDDLFMVPTAEVPITNLHADDILHNKDLPIHYQAYTPCFRRESGRHASEGGIIRVHQFNKVELVKFCEPEESMKELEVLTADAVSILEGLELPYRVLELCTGDLSFSSAKTYDLEVWIPGQKTWIEVSSCSNFMDFQARRANIKYRPQPHLPTEFIHTLNGSGLAIGRTMVAILENYQNEDGTVTIPKILQPYMGGETVIGVEPKQPKGMG